MAILTTKGRLAVKAQGSGWGTPETSFSASDFVEAQGPVVPPLNRETLSVDTFRPGFAAVQKVPGAKAGTTFSLTIPLHGWSAATPSGDPTAHPDATILEAILGSAAADAYTAAITSGSTTSSVKVTDGQADANWAGYAQLAASGQLWWAKTIDTGGDPDTIAPLVELASAPSAGAAYGSHVIWLADSSVAPSPLTIQWLGNDATAAIRYWDALPTKATITLAAKQQPMLEVELTALNWTNDGTGGAPADYAYAYPQMPACIGNNGFSAVFSGGAEICPRQVVLEFTQTLVEAECASASEGVDSLVVSERMAKATITVNPSDLSAAPWTYAPGDTPAALQIVANTIPGRAFSACFPAPQIAEQPQSADNGGLLGLSYVIEGMAYTGDTGSTAPADTPCRVAFL